MWHIMEGAKITHSPSICIISHQPLVGLSNHDDVSPRFFLDFLIGEIYTVSLESAELSLLLAPPSLFK